MISRENPRFGFYQRRWLAKIVYPRLLETVSSSWPNNVCNGSSSTRLVLLITTNRDWVELTRLVIVVATRSADNQVAQRAASFPKAPG